MYPFTVCLIEYYFALQLRYFFLALPSSATALSLFALLPIAFAIFLILTPVLFASASRFSLIPSFLLQVFLFPCALTSSFIALVVSRLPLLPDGQLPFIFEALLQPLVLPARFWLFPVLLLVS